MSYMNNPFGNRNHDRFNRFDDEVFICREANDRRDNRRDDDDRRDRKRNDDDRRNCRRDDDDRRDCRRDDDDRRNCRRDDDDRRNCRRDDDDRRDRRHDDDDCRRDDGRCHGGKLAFCTTGTGILFGVAIGDRVLIRVKNNTAELSLVFQGMIDHIALFTNGTAGTGLLRIPLKDIVTVRIA